LVVDEAAYFAYPSRKEGFMPSSKTLTLQISDIVQWYRKKELVINETFQRYSVWTPQAKTFLIDTILHALPIPKIYIRTILNPKHQTSVREIVDGQQRVRAIVEFADNKLLLSKRSDDYQGMRYGDLHDEQKEAFLGYIMTVDQLLNASDDDVIDIFARLNSYTVTLNAAEKRHAEFQTEFKHAVRKTAEKFRSFIEKYSIFTVRQRFRMLDDEFFAQAFGIIIQGVTDGGATRLRKLYTMEDDDTFTEHVQKEALNKLTFAIDFLDANVPDILSGILGKHYQVLMLIAAILHHKYGIPPGQIDPMPTRSSLASSDTITYRVAALEHAFSAETPPQRYGKFIEASSSSTQRISSRRIRFPFLCGLVSD